MPRRQMMDGGTKNRIVEVGRRMLFENGFEGTSIRAIMNSVGANVGTFYYYFNTKDQLICEILDGFFAPYRKDMAAIADEAKNVPYRALLRFFMYEQTCVCAFRAKYSKTMHVTVRMAIRERSLREMEPYIEDIINTLIGFGAKPCMDAHTMAIFLSHGVGSCLLSETSDWVDSVSDDLRRAVNLIMGLNEETARNMFEKSGTPIWV